MRLFVGLIFAAIFAAPATAQPRLDTVAIERADEQTARVRLPRGTLRVEFRRFNPPADPRVYLDDAVLFEPDPEYFALDGAWRLNGRVAVLFSTGCQTCGWIDWYFYVFAREGAPRRVEGFRSRYTVDHFLPRQAVDATGLPFPPRIVDGRWVRERFDLSSAARQITVLPAAAARDQNCRALYEILASCPNIESDAAPDWPLDRLRPALLQALHGVGNVDSRTWHDGALEILQGRERPFWMACARSHRLEHREPRTYAAFARSTCGL